jgi:hypothetical protein
MPILHKNINNSADIHNPKWFDSANNGDYAWRNELGALESTDELVLPAALDFVDASVAPPTTNTGDIYVLATGGSVNAGWGAVALKDWVRYDGTDWNEITPQKSTLCYDEDEDKLYSYDGTIWNVIGGDSIYTASSTAFLDVEIEIDNSLSFTNGVSKLWEWLDTGNVNINQDSTIETGTDTLTVSGDGGGTESSDTFRATTNAGKIAHFGGDTGACWVTIDSSGDNVNGFLVYTAGGGYKFRVGYSGSSEADSYSIYSYTSGNDKFFIDADDDIIIGHKDGTAPSPISVEDILLDGRVAIKGAGTVGNALLTLYDNDTTPNLLWFWSDDGTAEGNGDLTLNDSELTVNGADTSSATAGFKVVDSASANKFEVRNNGDLYTNGTQGFTGTGAYTNFTITNGIVTSAS